MATPWIRYAPRRIRSLGVRDHDGWRLKRYAITYDSRVLNGRVLESAESLALAALPMPATALGRHGVGFLGIHLGRDADLVFVSWWARQNELQHLVWTAAPGVDEGWRPATPDGLLGCVWDLLVLGHERQAWVDAVLATDPPDFEHYLANGLDTNA